MSAIGGSGLSGESDWSQLTTETFEEEFDRFARTAFRLETRQDYTGATGPRYDYWRRREPMPERSPRTSPYLARVAKTTRAGKRWQRAHIVELPLSEYMQYEMAVYAENVAAGEDIRIVDRTAHPALDTLADDFWLFDAHDSSLEHAVFLRFDDRGYPVRYERTNNRERLAVCHWQHDLVWSLAVPLSDFLADNSQHPQHGTGALRPSGERMTEDKQPWTL
jgi:hypothetical protein